MNWKVIKINIQKLQNFTLQTYLKPENCLQLEILKINIIRC